MSDLRNLLEKLDQFAGQAVGQKPGDQVRGTEKAKKKKSGEHPFKGRLVGESDNLLLDLETTLKETKDARDLGKEFTKFKEDKDPCWDNYKQIGMKMKGGKKVPNCVPKEGVEEGSSPFGNKCAGPFASEERAKREASRISKELGVKRYVEKTSDGKYIVVKKQGVAEGINTPDIVRLDVPLLIRLLEYAREDAKTDMDLHNVAERLIAMSEQGDTLSMDNYNSIVGGQVDEANVVEPNAPTQPTSTTTPNTGTQPPTNQPIDQKTANAIKTGLTKLKTSLPGIDPVKITNTMAKADTNVKLNPADTANFSKLAPQIADVIKQPQLAGQLKTILDKATTMSQAQAKQAQDAEQATTQPGQQPKV